MKSTIFQLNFGEGVNDTNLRPKSYVKEYQYQYTRILENSKISRDLK